MVAHVSVESDSLACLMSNPTNLSSCLFPELGFGPCRGAIEILRLDPLLTRRRSISSPAATQLHIRRFRKSIRVDKYRDPQLLVRLFVCLSALLLWGIPYRAEERASNEIICPRRPVERGRGNLNFGRRWIYLCRASATVHLNPAPCGGNHRLGRRRHDDNDGHKCLTAGAREVGGAFDNVQSAAIRCPSSGGRWKLNLLLSTSTALSPITQLKAERPQGRNSKRLLAHNKT